MSCLFNSIGHRLSKDPVAVRADICNFLEEHKDTKLNDMALKEWISASEEMPIEQYLQGMRQPTQWGGGFELIAATILYDTKIIVKYKGKEITIGDDDAGNTIKLNYSGTHYW